MASPPMAGHLAKAGYLLATHDIDRAKANAQAAQLVFMVGGEKEPVNRVMPLLELMGKKAFHLGPIGAGHAMKCINNLITAITFMATTEGLIVGKEFGLDPDVMTDVLSVSTGMPWISQTQFKQRIMIRKFDDPFRLEQMTQTEITSVPSDQRPLEKIQRSSAFPSA